MFNRFCSLHRGRGVGRVCPLHRVFLVAGQRDVGALVVVGDGVAVEAINRWLGCESLTRSGRADCLSPSRTGEFSPSGIGHYLIRTVSHFERQLDRLVARWDEVRKRGNGELMRSTALRARLNRRVFRSRLHVESSGCSIAATPRRISTRRGSIHRRILPLEIGEELPFTLQAFEYACTPVLKDEP
jgi:hypothetical protein